MSKLFKPVSFCGMFSRVLHVFWKRWVVFLSISAVVYALGWVFAVMTSLVLDNDVIIDGFNVQPYTMDLVDERSSKVWFFLVLEQLIYYCFLTIAHGANAWLVAHVYIDQYPSICEGFGEAFRQAYSLISSLFTIIIIVLIPFPIIITIIFQSHGDIRVILAGLVFWIYCMFITVTNYHVYPAIMVENCEPVFGSMHRSWNLSQGHRFNILGFLILWGLFKGIFGSVTQFIRQIGLDVGSDELYYFGASLDTILGMLFASINSVFEPVVYLNLRIIKENLDFNTLSKDLDDGPNRYVTMSEKHVEQPEP